MANEEVKLEQVKRKKCPFLGECCLEEDCAIRARVYPTAGGVMQQTTMCPVEALLTILSELNMKIPAPQQMLLPNRLFRG